MPALLALSSIPSGNPATPSLIGQNQPAAAYHRLAARTRKVSAPKMLPNFDENSPDHFNGFCKMTFASSSPLTPATESVSSVCQASSSDFSSRWWRAAVRSFGVEFGMIQFPVDSRPSDGRPRPVIKFCELNVSLRQLGIILENLFDAHASLSHLSDVQDR
jgi:hypothetical protein